MADRVSRIVVITRKTPLQMLVQRWGTVGQARFYLKTRDQSIEWYEAVDGRIQAGIQAVLASLPSDQKVTRVDRDDLDRFLFAPDDVVVIIGQDGLVPNVAKYLNGQLTFGINPDPSSYDGVLCRVAPQFAREFLTFAATAEGPYVVRPLTMVMATREDGQRLYGLNEIFIGHTTHQSARYRLSAASFTATGTPPTKASKRAAARASDAASSAGTQTSSFGTTKVSFDSGMVTERQSSSGFLCATGTGATGWARSIAAQRATSERMPRPDEARLVWFVREPFPSVSTGTSLNHGSIGVGDELVLVSEMGEGGTMFADGIEADRVEFADGQTVRVSLADRVLRLVVPAR